MPQSYKLKKKKNYKKKTVLTKLPTTSNPICIKKKK